MKRIDVVLVLMAVVGFAGCGGSDTGVTDGANMTLFEQLGRMDSGPGGSSEQVETQAALSERSVAEPAAEPVEGASGRGGTAADPTPADNVTGTEPRSAAQPPTTPREAVAGLDRAAGTQPLTAPELDIHLHSGSGLARGAVSSAQSAAYMATAAMEVAAPAPTPAPALLAEGRRVYSNHCMACHAAGVAGSPKLGDAGVWTPRIAKGLGVLETNAVAGFKGKDGYMPPKGGFNSLSDEQVRAAVRYMVSVID